MLNKLRQQRSSIALALLAVWVMLHLVGCLTVWTSSSNTDSPSAMTNMNSMSTGHHIAYTVGDEVLSHNQLMSDGMSCNDSGDACQSMNKWQTLLQLPLQPLFALLLIIPFLQLIIGSPIGLAIRRQQLRYSQTSPPINVRHCCWLK